MADALTSIPPRETPGWLPRPTPSRKELPQSLGLPQPINRCVPRALHRSLRRIAENDWPGASAINPNRKIFEARKRETAALGAGEKLVLGHPLAATIGDSARCMQNLEKVLFTGPKTSDTVTFICD